MCLHPLTNLLQITTDEEHLQNLDTVLSWLKEHGLRLKEKCDIWQSSVDYLGHHYDVQRIHVAFVKVDASRRSLHLTM